MGRKATAFDDELQAAAQAILDHPEARTVVLLVVPTDGGLRLSTAYSEEPDDPDSLVRGLLSLAIGLLTIVPEGQIDDDAPPREPDNA